MHEARIKLFILFKIIGSVLSFDVLPDQKIIQNILGSMKVLCTVAKMLVGKDVKNSERIVSRILSILSDTSYFCVLSLFLVILEKVPSCDQERQTAQDEAQRNPREAIFIPDCGLQGLYKPVQCHQSTGYCWCVLVDTGRPMPGTSAR